MKELFDFAHAPANFDVPDPAYEGLLWELTNRIRAQKAAAGLTAYWQQYSINQTGESPVTVAKDFLTDLLHWGDGQGIDIHDLLQKAQKMYEEEQS